MTVSPAPTQALRALPTLAELPPGCIAQPVTDDASWPHLMPGEFAIVDTADRTPVHGELFVIRYADPRSETGHVAHIVEIHRRPSRDEPGGHRWWAAPYVRPRSVDELAEWIEEGRPLILSQGPFAPGGLEGKLTGRIVGILAPAFEEPRRLSHGRARP